MENRKTIVVVGGGYAGINLIEKLKKEFQRELDKSIRIILIDKNSFHFKKVKLFKGIVSEHVTDLYVPLKNYCGAGIHFMQGQLVNIDQIQQTISIKTEDDKGLTLAYDHLVLALGSVIREISADKGGINLSNLENARKIRQSILDRLASTTSKIRIAIVGGGITGIETASEIREWLNHESEKAGKQKGNIEIFLINDKDRLLDALPVKVSERLETRLIKNGLKILHKKKTEKFSDGRIVFTDQSTLEADFCIWTIGMKSNPCLAELGLTLTEDGKLLVDPWYRIEGATGLYGIGDCVHIEDPTSRKSADMSCKEAIAQAQRLAAIIKADIHGLKSSPHQNYPDLLCIGLGPEDGLVWAQKWGIDFVLSGKLAEKVRDYTWDIASIH